MAINFPDSPTLNQEFAVGDKVWFWTGTVWKAKETPVLETGKYTVSDTAPLDPEEGDAWFDSARTKEFIYYDNFWIETSAAAVGMPAEYATEEYVDQAIAAIPEVDLTGYATESYVGTAISGVIDAAPETLNTLNELAAALNDDANFATTVTNAIAGKADSNHTHALNDLSDVTITDPTTNQVVKFNGSAWVNAAAGGGILASDTAPTDTNAYPLWYNTAEGRAYIYYDSFWVELSPTISGPPGPAGIIKSDTEPLNTSVVWVDTDDTTDPLVIPAGGTTGQVLQKATSTDYDTSWGGPYPTSPNYVINGGFDIWQRGTSFSGQQFTADRWEVINRSSSVTAARSTDVPNPVSKYSLQITHTNYNSADTFLRYKIERPTYISGPVTLSFWAKVASGSVTISTDINDRTSPNMTVTTSWQKFTQTFNGSTADWADTDYPSNNFTFIDWNFVSLPFTGTFYLAQVQLEAGTVATPFRRNANSIQGELAACQRYYQIFPLGGTAPVGHFLVATKWSTTDALVANLKMSVPMRIAPNVTIQNTTVRAVFNSAVTSITYSNTYSFGQELSLVFNNNSLSPGFGWIDSMGNLQLSAEL